MSKTIKSGDMKIRYTDKGRVYSDSLDTYVYKNIKYKGDTYEWNDYDCLYYNANGDEEDYMDINVFKDLPEGVTPVISSRKPIKSSGGSIRDELKWEIRNVLKENGYFDVEGGVNAAADYILEQDEYYSPSLSELPSLAEKWFKDTLEHFPEMLIKSSRIIKSSKHKLPTKKDYEALVNELNSFVAENYEVDKYGPLYKFNMYQDNLIENDDGWGNKYPCFIIYDAQGNLDTSSDDSITEYIRNYLSFYGWYPESVHSLSDFTIAVE